MNPSRFPNRLSACLAIVLTVACIPASFALPMTGEFEMQEGILNDTLGYPRLSFNTNGEYFYDADNDQFTAQATPISVQTAPGQPPIFISDGGGPQTLLIDANIDSTGELISGTVQIYGSVEIDGTTYTGLLVAGDAVDFGWAEQSGFSDEFDFRFAATGGLLVDAEIFCSNGLFGLQILSEKNSFIGNWVKTHKGMVKGTVGPLPGYVGDFVWFDANGNGIQDTDEPGIGGVKLNLEADFDKDGTIDYTAMTFTDENGGYIFDCLPLAGNYTVTVDPSNFLPGGPLAGLMPTDPMVGDPATDSNGSPTTTMLAPDMPFDDTLDFGFKEPPEPFGSLGDFVWNDLDMNGQQDANEPGIPNVMVTLMIDLDQDGVYDETQTTTTDAFGIYGFDNLPLDAKFKVTLDDSNFAPGGALEGLQPTPTNVGDDATDSDYPMAMTILTTGFDQDLTLDFGFFTPEPELGSIGNFVWNDLDGDGIQDDGEPGIPGVIVILMIDADKDGTYEDTISQLTDGNGMYLFAGLELDANYKVTIDAVNFQAGGPLDGLEATLSDIGDDALDSDFPIALTMLMEGLENDLSLDFGFVEPVTPTGTVGDFVWNDTNMNGVQDFMEPGIGGVAITLMIDEDKDGVFDSVQTTTTNQDGGYGFAGLPLNANYKVTIDDSNFEAGGPLEGFIPSPTNVGDDTLDSDYPMALTMLTDVFTDDPTLDFGFFEPAPCDISVDALCMVVPPPQTGNYDCDGKIKQLTMRWSGSGTVDIVAHNGDVGDPIVSIQEGIEPGDIVVVDYPDASQNDVYWEIFAGNTNIGESKFHLSCSDDDMDGPEDCGKFQGNGKDDANGLINDWQLEGLIDKDGDAFSCTPDDLVFAESCTVFQDLTDQCDNGNNPETLTWRVITGDCTTSMNSQGPIGDKWDCTGSIDPNAAITVQPDNGPSFVVQPGELFVVERNDSKTFELSNGGGTQDLEIHTSCSQPLIPGDTYGNLQLVLTDNSGLGQDVVLKYVFNNNGSTDVSISATDSALGGDVPGTPLTVEAGGMDMVSTNLFVASSFIGTVSALGTTDTGATCPAMDTLSVDVEIPPAPPGSCDDGKPTELVFVYTGDGCDATTNFQEGKLECSPDPGPAPGPGPVDIVMTRDADKITVSPATGIMEGDLVSISRDDGNSFASETELEIQDANGNVLQALNVHTSCSKALVEGDQFGALFLDTFVPEANRAQKSAVKARRK